MRIPKTCGSDRRRLTPGCDAKPKGGTAEPIKPGSEVRADELSKAAAAALRRRGHDGNWRNGRLRRKPAPQVPLKAHTGDAVPEGRNE